MNTPQLIGVLAVALVLASGSIALAWQVRKDTKGRGEGPRLDGWREYDLEDKHDDR